MDKFYCVGGVFLECHFCENIFERNRELGLPEQESIVYEDENIFVMPDICPLSVGHMLIISRIHYQGFASAGQAVVQSVEKFLEYYRKKIGGRNFTVFEHGAVISYNAGASIDHAHIHIVPYELNMKQLLNQYFSNPLRYNLGELSNYSALKQPYLFYKNGNEEKGYIYPVNRIKSQFLRDIANQLMNRRMDYNWKNTYGQTEFYIEFHKTLAWWRSLSYPMTFKWKKKLLLENYGLAEYQRILNETNRFLYSEYNLVTKMLQKELKCKTGNYFRLVLVPLEHQYKLPNYIITCEKELEQFEETVKRSKSYQEIWYYRGDTKELLNTISGRIAYSWNGAETMEIIELVNGNNPRLIEKYTLENQNYDYMMAFRINNEKEYHIHSCSSGVKYSEQEWNKCFNEIRIVLGNFRDKLQPFCNMIKSYGVYSLSLDFKWMNNTLSFIDWDTSNDMRILENEKVF